MSDVTAAASTSVREELVGPGRRPVTVGIVLLISLIAFENMGVSTAMPALVADLGSVDLYAWPFVSFVAASVLGTVLGGRWCDTHGARWPLLVAPAVFGAGLLVAGTAETFAQLLLGRVLQGAGAGVQGVAVYVLIAAVYSAAARPAVFGLISSAWVLPSLVGPPVAGLVTDTVSWHWVFLGLVPLVVLAMALVAPAVRTLQPLARGGDGDGDGGTRRPQVLLPATAAALAVAALSWAGQEADGGGAASWVVGLVAAASLGVLVPALRRLLPPGTLSARRGVAAVVLCRGLIAGAFFATTAYLPLLLTDVHGWSLTAAGTPLIAGSLGWSASSAWQGRHPDLARPVLLRVGFAGVAAGAAALLLVTPTWGAAWVAVPAWTVAGLGMGLGFSAISQLLLEASPPALVGANSAAAQLGDGLAQAVFVGVGGALVATAATVALGLSGLVVVVVALAALGVWVSPRTAAPAPR
ncbi:MFS transporter [Nocardioides nanhaiensis]|uniref:MFS transporter n=1 Tax=Nocardioides nanhaiensis TaxID=1476871 RepID=A0ABP8WF36_9ACTN